MLTLTLGPLTAEQSRSFGLAISLLLGVASGLIVPRQRLLIGALAGLLAFGTGLVFPIAFQLAHRVWNRFVRVFAPAARLAVSAICFFVVFTATGSAGSSLAIARRRRGESLWAGRPHRDSTPSASQHLKDYGELSGFTALLQYAGSTRNWWILSLFPFLVLFQALETGSTTEEAEDIYTLF